MDGSHEQPLEPLDVAESLLEDAMEGLRVEDCPTCEGRGNVLGLRCPTCLGDRKLIVNQGRLFDGD